MPNGMIVPTYWSLKALKEGKKGPDHSSPWIFWKTDDRGNFVIASEIHRRKEPLVPIEGNIAKVGT